MPHDSLPQCVEPIIKQGHTYYFGEKKENNFSQHQHVFLGFNPSKYRIGLYPKERKAHLQRTFFRSDALPVQNIEHFFSIFVVKPVSNVGRFNHLFPDLYKMSKRCKSYWDQNFKIVTIFVFFHF